MFALCLALCFAPDAQAARAKDVGRFDGLQSNSLTGMGLVVGLARTGDSNRNAASIRSLVSRLKGIGASVSEAEIMSRNIALVMVTATLPPDARIGSMVDLTVASTGDAMSLEGGMLLQTPLMGMDGEIHCLGQGPIVVGGFNVVSGGNSTRKAVPTRGTVIRGAQVMMEVPGVNFAALESIDFILDEPDFTTATRLEEAVDLAFGSDVASAVSSSTVALTIPQDYRGRFASFAARIESVQVSPDVEARVVVDERTGTVVMGADVRIAAVAVTHGALTIEVQRTNAISQPTGFAAGTTAAVSNAEINVSENKSQLTLVEGANIGDLVSALNAMGVSPRDLITILSAMHAAGAIHAEIVTR